MKVLFQENEIRRRVAELGREISAFYAGKPFTLLAVANGGLFFGCDLSREISVEHWFDTVALSSYVQDKKSSELRFRCPPKLEIRGRHLLMADDIFDTGESMEFCRRRFLDEGALSVRFAVLVTRDSEAGKSAPDWAGFHCGEGYLIGCGMDSCEKYRNLRFIGVL